MSVTPGQLLQATADYFKTHNWCGTAAYGEGAFNDEATAVCLVVGINRAACNLNLNPEIAKDLIHAAWDQFERHVGMGIIKWNETPQRTKEQVIIVLEKAGSL